MSNRRKMKSLKGVRGLRGRVSAVDEAGPRFSPGGFMKSVDLPDDEKVLLKQVPAKHGDVVIGIANLYDDGSVDVVMNEDVPQEILDEIKGVQAEYENMFGYNAVLKED